jgi:hypothetical protein
MKASEIVDGLVDEFVEQWQGPAKRIGYAVSLAAVVVCARAGMRPAPSTLISCLAGLAAMRAYMLLDDVHQAALAQREYIRGQYATAAKAADDASAGTD